MCVCIHKWKFNLYRNFLYFHSCVILNNSKNYLRLGSNPIGRAALYSGGVSHQNCSSTSLVSDKIINKLLNSKYYVKLTRFVFFTKFRVVFMHLIACFLIQINRCIYKATDEIGGSLKLNINVVPIIPLKSIESSQSGAK